MNVPTNHQAPHGAATNRSTLMRRTLLVTAVTAIVVAVALLTVAAAPAAPRWPAASLAYWQEAQPLLETLAAESPAAFKAAGNPASAGVISDTVTAVTTIVDAVAELDPPPPLLAVHAQLAYAASTCQSSVKYAQTVDFTGLVGASQIPVFAQFSLECLRSIKDTQVEAARYAATVGGFPTTE